MDPFLTQLREYTQGEVKWDAISKRVYSVDASIYEIEPIAILLPKNKEDIVTAAALANKYKVPIIPRGAATGITGGCLGRGLIIDTSKYLNRILQINVNEEYAICEPGVVQDQLNHALAKLGYRLGPETSTGNRATIGGMFANNSAGARSLKYGKMVDHVLEAEMILASSEIFQTQSREGPIYQELLRIREEYREEIETRFPNIPRRVSGYNLDELIKSGPINLCQVLVGSEGSLGIATEIKVRISKIPKRSGLCVIHFSNMDQGMDAVMDILSFHPTAIEMIDHKILEMARLSPTVSQKLDWLQGNPAAVFAVEFDGDKDAELHKKMQPFVHYLEDNGIGYAHSLLLSKEEMSQVWDVRKAGLTLLLSKRSYTRAIAFIEDISVAPSHLATFIREFKDYLSSINKEAGIYGHVGSGVIHLRPYLDMRDPNEIRLMEQVMKDVTELVIKHRGALSGEHGDGLLRSWLNRKMFGDKIYQAFTEVKQVFDPDNLMNPGKIVNGPPFSDDLRLSPTTPIKEIKTYLNFDAEGGFSLAADLCNGNGLCRKSESLMCPSFQATKDEFTTTRARAQAMRGIIHGQLPENEFTGDGLYKVLDLCLECKGCKTECPSQVDMAKMKSEFLYQYHKKHGIPWRDHLFAHIGTLNQWTHRTPSFANWVNQTSFAKFLLKQLGITTLRDFPKLAERTFSSWVRQQQTTESTNKVVLFNDTFTEFNHPEIGIAAYRVLNALGYEVIVPKWQCCGRPMLSKGLLPQAQKKAHALVTHLNEYVTKGYPIIGLEPSCLLTIKDDYEGLLGHVKELSQACITFDEFIAQNLPKEQLSFNRTKKPILLHGHCHQKALVGTRSSLQVLSAVTDHSVTEIPSGCCGMAGSFGFEEEHYAISMKIGELKLFPVIRNAPPDAIIIANGFSCRQQIQHGVNSQALHLAQLLEQLME